MISNHSYPKDSVTRRNAECLALHGSQVDLICSGDRSDAGLSRPPEGLRVIRLPFSHRRSSALRYLIEYAAFSGTASLVATYLVLRRAYATVQVDNPPDLLAIAALPARWRGARIVLNMVELVPEMTATRLRVSRRHPIVRLSRVLESMAMGMAQHVITVSNTCLRVLEGRGLDPRRVTIVPNSVDVSVTGERQEPDPPRLVTLASLIERYGVQVAIRAMPLLRDRWPGLTLHVLGEGEYKGELIRLSHELGVADRVVFQGFVPWDEAMRQVRSATIGLVPVIADGYGELIMPTKLMEMVALGVPVVCARLPAIEEYFPADALAYFRAADPESMAARIDELLRDPEMRREQSDRARIAAKGQSWAAVTDRYVSAVLPGAAVGETP
jgi:glycosyltransferase involved in cell wall biosynthesis